jgi:hypothetical protein
MSYVTRITEYYRRHGIVSTVRRALVQAKRSVFASGMVVFYCDLSEQAGTLKMPGSAAVERVRTFAELKPEHLQEMTSFWNPKQALRNIEERLGKGATLWLITSGGHLAGYGWTIQGSPIAPYYFPLGSQDVQLFDFYVFPKFRGRAMHWLITTYILRTLAAEGSGRAYADTGEWNEAQLAAFKMTPFRPLGMVRTFTMFGRMFTRWSEYTPVAQPKKQRTSEAKPLAVARSNER